MFVFLAHGSLDVFDELIWLTVAVAFFGMMIYAYIRSRALEDADLPAVADPAAVDTTDPDSPDRFKLD